MLTENLRSLTNWEGYVSLHNLPFRFNLPTEVIQLSSPEVVVATVPQAEVRSFYEMQKSAINWSWMDFKV